MVLTVQFAAALLLVAGPAVEPAGPVGPFEGLSSLVVEPENSWGWDTPVFGALQERGFRVDFGPVPSDLSPYDLVALTIKRSLDADEVAALREFVTDGGALYGSWGGPFSTPLLHRDVCRVASWRSTRVRRFDLLDSPLSKGIPDAALIFAEHVGHVQAGADGWETVVVEPAEDGIPVARDADGNCLGVLAQYGRGRTAVLGFGPERDKQFARPELGVLMMDNLLAWLLEERLARPETTPSNRITLALPARAAVKGLSVNGEAVARPEVRRVGSLNLLEIDVSGIAEGARAVVRVTYGPLPEGRNVETVIHLPWNTMRAAAKSPAGLAEYVASLNVRVCQPLLRGSFGQTWYRGMPDDKHDDVLVKQYEGDFLADLVRECHARGIRVVGGVYLDNSAPLRQHPDLRRLDRDGKPITDRYGREMACFNDPRSWEYNLAAVEHLLENWDLDGLTLDDNFELDKNDCYCAYCREGFRQWCADRGLPWEDPLCASGAEFRARWREYRRERTRALCGEVRKVARAHGVRAGGWVSASMDAMHLKDALDFLGGMVYTTPPRSARGPLSVLGDTDFTCLLWAPHADPAMIRAEARDAVHAGCATVGYWIRGDDGGYAMDRQRTEAMRQALDGVEREWLAFYRDSLLSGDLRFAVVEGKATETELMLTVANAGKRVDRRVEGPLDLAAFAGASGR